MNRKERKPLAEPIAEMQRELEEYRSSQPSRARLPESIWEAAAGLAREHGVYAVAQALRLDYMGLKKRVGGEVASQRPASSEAVFVELIAPPLAKTLAKPEECLIECVLSASLRKPVPLRNSFLPAAAEREPMSVRSSTAAQSPIC